MVPFVHCGFFFPHVTIENGCSSAVITHSWITFADPSFDPSIALASLIQHIPVQMITVLIKSLTTDQNVKDASMTKALCR